MFWTVTLSILQGCSQAVKLFFLTLLFALPLGLVVAFGSMSRFRPLKRLTQGFVWIIRGTPLMLQLIAIFYGPGLLFGIHGLGRFDAVVVAFVINYACYFSEIYRGGIESIPQGQYEAGQVLGMTKSQIFFKVVLLQVIKRIVTPMGNEFITLVKDTALITAIGVTEILYFAKSAVNRDVNVSAYVIAAVFYLVMTYGLTKFFGWLEKKCRY